MLFAIALVPLVVAVGMALDYSRATSARAAMQAALDSTALMLSKEALKLEENQLNENATKYFKSLFTRTEVNNLSILTTFTRSQNDRFGLDLKVSGTINTTLLNLIGYDKLLLAVDTEVKWGIKQLQLALVLDNTKSMASSGKMSALKAAAKDLISILKKTSSQTNDIKIAIIPYNTDVNVGDLLTSSWLNWDEWDLENGYRIGTKWVPYSHTKWNGCVTDRDKDFDVLNTAPSSSSTSFIPHQADPCPSRILPLTSDWTALQDKIDSMIPDGLTNITIGLAWGWQAVTSSNPLNAPVPTQDTDRVIILLTDGENTKNRWTRASPHIDERTEAICKNIKDEKVKIYTIRVIEGNAGLLQKCATNSTMYYDVQQASQLEGVFNAIAQSLTSLHISK